TYLEHELEMVFSKDPWKLNGGWGVRASGMTMTFNARAEAGRRLGDPKSNRPGGDHRRAHTIPSCGGQGEPPHHGCRHAGTHNVYLLPMSIQQALRQYLTTHPAVTQRRDGREIALDLPRTVFSQDAVLAGGDPIKAPTNPSGLPT